MRDPATGKYCGQSHRKCRWDGVCEAFCKQNEKGEVVKKLRRPPPFAEMQERDKADAWIEKWQEDCLFCRSRLRHKEKFRDAVKNHCHISGKFRGAAHSECNKKLRLNIKTLKIPVVFHNLQGYDAHLIMQAIANTNRTKELGCTAKNMEKYISFEFGNLKFIDSCAFMAASLDSLVKATPKESLKKTEELAKAQSPGGEHNLELLTQKGVYP